MKVSRISKYKPTKGERRHKSMVEQLKNKGYRNAGTMTMKKLLTATKHFN